MTENQKKSLLDFFKRHPHPPWMDNPRPYFGKQEE